MLLKRGEDYMRLFVSVDYEGIWGVPSWEFMKTEEAKQLLHKELNVLLKSIEEVDANAYVLMVDSHSRGDNICRSMLETSSVKLDLISGYPRPNYMMTGIDNSFDGSCLWLPHKSWWLGCHGSLLLLIHHLPRSH